MISEKRFKMVEQKLSEESICLNFYDGEKKLYPQDIVDLLNSLNDENEQLKADEKLYAKEILRLKEELKQREIVKLGGDY